MSTSLQDQDNQILPERKPITNNNNNGSSEQGSGGEETNTQEQEEGEHEDKIDRSFDLSYDYFGLDQKVVFEMVERKSLEILRNAFGGVQSLADKLRVNIGSGISHSEVEERQKSFGVNVLNKKEDPSFWEFLKEALEDKVVIILEIAAVVSIVLGLTVPNPHTGEVEYSTGWIEGTAIIISVLVVTLTGSINNYQKALQFQEMEKEQAIKPLIVLREGQNVTINSDELVVGDILFIGDGQEMPADGLVVQASNLKISEAAITGESDQIEKSPEDDPFILSGTSVDEGAGQMVVIGVGMNSFQGHLKRSLDEESGETPLQEHLSELADLIGYFGFALAFILVAALCIKEGILVGTDEKELEGTNFLNFFLIAVTLVVVAIPEGLPLAVTIALAFSMKAMMDDQCMVRVLESCETMGAATAVCSDKTGTLTTNIMTCVQGCIGGEEFLISGYGSRPRNENVKVCDRNNFSIDNVSSNVLETFCESLSLNSGAEEQVRDGQVIWVGNKTEIGMLKLLALMNYDYKTPRTQHDMKDASSVRQYPFSSAKKSMATITREKDGSINYHVKGASEIILAQCQSFMNAQGQIVGMSAEDRANFEAVIEDIAVQGNRTIGVAYSPNVTSLNVEANGHLPKEEPAEISNLVFLGIMGIQDPIREEVPPSILRCHSAGLIIRMCTGDNITTALSIAKKCHIYEENGWDMAMLGVDFRRMHDTNIEALKKILPRLKVLARSSPNDKYILVEMLKEQGEVVGVTGDGTNDAPALKLADVGFAMKSGTDIAKGASDMVLLDDNFATVVTAIRWGRAVNDNIKKFLQFQLTINVAGVLLTLIASLASENSKEPFTPVQLLWLNLIMDTLAALSLATELPEEASLDRSPIYKDGELISRRMWCFIIFHGTWQFALILVLLFLGHKWFNTIEEPEVCDDLSIPRTRVSGEFTDATAQYCERICEKEGGIFTDETFICQQGTVHSTILFNIFIWSQVFNVINSRKIHGEQNPLEGLWDRSKQLLLIFIFIAGFQAIAVELFGRFMSTTGLSGKNWGICLGIAAIELILGIFQRLIPVEDITPEAVIERRERVEELRRQVEAENNSNNNNNNKNSSSSPFGSPVEMTPIAGNNNNNQNNGISASSQNSSGFQQHPLTEQDPSPRHEEARSPNQNPLAGSSSVRPE